MIVTPLVKKGIATAPISKGDILNTCYPNVQSSAATLLLDARKIAAGDVILIKGALAPHPKKFPTAENLLKALKGNLEKTGPEPLANYLVAQNPKFDLVNETDKAQPGVSFTRIFFGDDQLPDGEFIDLSVNTGIFFTDEGLNSLSAGNITFASREWKRLKFEVINSSLPIAMKGSTPAFTHQNAILVDTSVIKYATVGMSLYTTDATIFDSVGGEVKVIAVDHNNGIIFLSEDNVADSIEFVFTLTPTINITPLDGAGPSSASSGVAWGDITGDITDQTDLQTILSDLTGAVAAAIPVTLIGAKGDLIVGASDNTATILSAGSNGSFLRAASGQASGLEWQKNNMAAAVDPAATDDVGLGYTPGSRWLNTTASREFVCISNTDNAAVWFSLGASTLAPVNIVGPTSLPAANLVDIINIPAAYRSLILILTGVSFDTTTRRPEVVWSSDNGSTFNTTGFYGHMFNSNGTAAVVNGAPLIQPTTYANTQFGSIIAFIEGYSSAALPLRVTAHGFYADALAYSAVQSTIAATAVLNALRIRNSGTGNFDAGTYQLIGCF